MVVLLLLLLLFFVSVADLIVIFAAVDAVGGDGIEDSRDCCYCFWC